MTVIRRLRVAVQQETVEEVNRNGDRAAQTLCHRAGEPFDPVEMPQVDRSSTPEECCPPMVRVVQGDCLEQARLMLDAGARRVAVLNMANPRTPGGGWRQGCGAQEENIHRRTALFRSLAEAGKHYPIPADGVLYSPSVSVFRGPESEGYAFHAPFEVAIISCPADASPTLVRGADGALRLDERSAERLKRKVFAILEVADAHGQEGLVLSALGCGAFHNPPDHVALLFREGFSQYFAARGARSGSIREVVFAIFDDHNVRCRCGHNPRGNLVPFQEAFSSEGDSVNRWRRTGSLRA
eukprot:Tamp_11741.p1 GENE.Tamp_11741~~Tamp_11741.p1  ORF type:complete len:327 (-),score=60.25 Tamp_11741:904-1794(-)